MLVTKCTGLEPGPLPTAADSEKVAMTKLADRNFWAQYQRNMRHMLSITGAVYIPIEWHRIADAYPWTSSATLSALRQVVAIFEALDHSRMHVPGFAPLLPSLGI